MSPTKPRPSSTKDSTVKRSSSPKKKVLKDNFVENLKKMLEEDLAKPEKPKNADKIKEKSKVAEKTKLTKIPKPAPKTEQKTIEVIKEKKPMERAKSALKTTTKPLMKKKEVA